MNYRQVSNISRPLVGNKIVDDSDVVGASPVGAAPTLSWFKKISFGHQIRQFTADNCPVPEPTNNQIGNRKHNTANMRSFGCAVDSNTNSLLPPMHGFDSQNIRQGNISRASYRT